MTLHLYVIIEIQIEKVYNYKEKDMDIFGVLTMIGGLVLFLFGMNVMGDGLEKLSGGTLEKVLEKLTSKKIMAVLLGAAVTAVIQSSSATTVMVVGFVNSGIMKLSQAVGIIMGANIGTTVTSWILSLSGIEGDSIFIQMLKPTSFAPVLAVVGIIMYMSTKSDKRRNVGLILLGFTVLMYGMTTMSDAVAPLADVPEFTQILTLFSNPFLGVLAGAVLTAVIQSSSASVGILQALCATGAIPFGTALPIIMGQNIGTCATALISSIGANKNAKRAAMVHLYFNIIGTIIFMAVFYALNAFIGFAFIDEAAAPAGIAIIHSVFNIFATIILMPFTKLLEKLACLTIRDKNEPAKEKDEFQLLDQRFLATPAFAIEQCKTLTAKMAEISKDAFMSSISLLNSFTKKTADYVIAQENTVDTYEDKIGTYLVQLSSKSLSETDSKSISLLLHCIGDFERISDHAVNILEAAREMEEKDLHFSPKAKEELSVYTSALMEIVNTAFNAFTAENLEYAKAVEPLEEVIDELRNQLKKRHIKRLQKGKCTIELGFILQDLITNYERIADHCSNIAVCLIQIADNSFDMHEYLNELKKTEDRDFADKYKFYRSKYLLP